MTASIDAWQDRLAKMKWTSLFGDGSTPGNRCSTIIGETGSFVFLAGIGHGELKVFRLRPAEPGLSPQAAFSSRSVEKCVGHYLESLKSTDFDVELEQHANRLVASADTLVPPKVPQIAFNGLASQRIFI